MASFPDIDELSSMLKPGSRFFMEIRSVTDVLNNLNHFLEGADAESVEKLLRSLVDRTDVAEGHDGKHNLDKLSEVLREQRVVDFLSRAGHCFGIRDSEDRIREEGTGNRRLVYSFVNEYFDSSKKDVLAWLTEEAPGCSTLSLSSSSSIGENGYGLRLFNSNAPRGDFDRPYWIDVCGLYKIQNLLKLTAQEPRVGEQRSRVFDAMGKMALVDKLMRHSVQRNRYMFVLDDVFHQEFWNVVNQGLRENDKRNWIITTARIDESVTSLKKGSFDQILKLGPLSDTESWELFCRIAFQDEPEQHCVAELEPLSEEIVKKCKGFPLPIVGIAGLLSKKGKEELEWQRVHNSFEVTVKTTLHLPRALHNPDHGSYDYLPSHLRPCFLYFGVFPPDSVISNDKLFKLWIAEGFVQEYGEKTLEEVAEEYLTELIRRNLVQSFRGLDRLEHFCQVDKLMYPTTQLNSYNLSFCNHVFEEDDLTFLPRSGRLSMHSNRHVDRRYFNHELRSLFLFGGVCDNSVMTDLIRKCEALTMLDFEHNPIEHLPEELGKLIHLKYLNLKNTKVRNLPKSVDKLVNLQTLDLRNTLVDALPIRITTLKNLRYLLANVCDNGVTVNPTRGVRLYKGIGRLHNLHTLTMVEAFSRAVGIMTELTTLHQLRTLGVSGLTTKTATALCESMNTMSRLKSLTLQAADGHGVLILPSVSYKLPHLQRLVLKGRFQNLPNWIFRVESLSVLCLSLTLLTEDQLVQLSHLPNLASLWLCGAYEGDRLSFKEGSFGQLKLLVVREFHQLNEMEIEDGALPRVEELRIGSSPHLNEVPSGIQHLKNLKILVNYDMSKEFVVRMQPNGGLDYQKVMHIPCVLFLFRVIGREYKLFELGDSELADHILGLATNPYRITEPQDEHEFIGAGPFSFYKAQSSFQQKISKQSSFSSSIYTDDLEE